MRIFYVILIRKCIEEENLNEGVEIFRKIERSGKFWLISVYVYYINKMKMEFGDGIIDVWRYHKFDD